MPYKDPQKRKAYDAARYAADPAAAKARAKRSKLLNPDRYKAYDRKASRKRLGIVDPTCEVRKGECELCGVTKNLVPDHCHKTVRMRGWICSKCNTGLGLLGDDYDGICRAVAYLVRAREVQG